VRILAAWLAIGGQSFGGGLATLTLIRQSAVERYGWISEEEFTRYWSMVQLAPGINLLALTILIGRKIGGMPYVALCLVGLVLPTAIMTAIMTALYAHVQNSAWIHAALQGALPAIVGLGLLTGVQAARPLFVSSYREGPGSVILSSLVLVASGVSMLFFHAPVVLVLICAALICALASYLRSRRISGDASRS
jgi:chromate transporter